MRKKKKEENLSEQPIQIFKKATEGKKEGRKSEERRNNRRRAGENIIKVEKLRGTNGIPNEKWITKRLKKV